MILVKVDLKERLARLKQGLQMIFFSIVKVLSNMIFPYFECMHLGLVSFAFFRYDWLVMQNYFHYN
jgi:hypothetical protein